MSRMPDLGDVLELINDRFDNRLFTDHQAVKEGHDAVLHVGLELGDQLDIEGTHQVFEQGLRDITLIAIHLSKEMLE